MEFQREREMFDSARKWLGFQGFMTKAEFRTPWGICDLVGVLFNDSRVKQRLQLGQTESIGPPLRIELFDRIPDLETGRAVGPGRLEREFGEFLTPASFGKRSIFSWRGNSSKEACRGRCRSSMGGRRCTIVSWRLNLNLTGCSVPSIRPSPTCGLQTSHTSAFRPTLRWGWFRASV